MTGATPTELVDGEDRRKHLELIQGVVTRMSAASSNAKSWLLPVVTAAYGFALTNSSGSVAAIGVVAVLLFSYVDANYLRQERAYRALYDAVALGSRPVPSFSLNPAHAGDPLPDAPTRGSKPGKKYNIGRWLPRPSIWLSWSIAPFYGLLLVLGMGVFVHATI